MCRQLRQLLRRLQPLDVWYDVTRSIHPGMPVYPGDPPVKATLVADYPAVTRWSLGSHTGTHVDAPRHLGFDGGVDSLSLEVLCGPAEVRSAEEPPVALPMRVLLKGDSLIDEAWTEALLIQGVRLIGVEGLSIEEGLEAHLRLLEAGVVILEGLDLSSVPPGEYQLFCLPLKLRGGDGAPARVVLHD